jgi:transcriptional regulator with GAF, ATPase, and Fis domain
MRNSELQALTTEVAGSAVSPELEPRAAALHVVYPPELVQTITLDRPQMTLGRQPGDGTPPLLHTLVSRKHFTIAWDAEHHFHTGVDLGSSNGSSIDGIPAKTPLALRDGSVLRVGPALIVYERTGAAAVEDSDAAIEAAIPGRSAAARALRAQVARVAKDPAAVLVRGETGTGKESIAHEIHRLSGRRGALIALNCAALAPHLLESELFGHVRGAFSGATQDHQGLFRAAHGGTLLLDEIGELDLALQPKLLRALQENAVRPVGATRDVHVDVRVIAATNRDLAAQVETGEFRRDLHARLALLEIEVPPLRRRRADVFIWLERLHARFRQTRGLAPAPLPVFDTAAAELILQSEQPDNLRGLDKLVHALSALPSDRPLALSDLPTALASGAAPAVSASAPTPAEWPASAKPPFPSR